MIHSRAVINWQALKLGGMRIFLASVVTCKISGGSERLPPRRSGLRPPQPASANQSQPLADHDMSMNDGDQSQPLADHVNERDDERGRACFVWCLFPIR